MRPGNIKGPDDFTSKVVPFSFPSNLDRFWCGQDVNRTYFFNALGILAPSFERLFILSVLKFRKPIKGTDLESSMRTFLKQEAQHDHQIQQFNQSLKQFGYPIDKLEQANLNFCKKLNNLCSAKTQLSFTMGAEHLIALISEQNLKDSIWFKQACPQMAALWRWHAIEEIEHKSVAFDIYHRVCGQYFRKIWGFVVVTAVIGGMWLHNWWVMAKHDKMLWRPRFWWDTFVYLWFKPGIFRKLLGPMLSYFSPRFHPWNHDNSYLIAKWKRFFQKQPSDQQVLNKLMA